MSQICLIKTGDADLDFQDRNETCSFKLELCRSIDDLKASDYFQN